MYELLLAILAGSFAYLTWKDLRLGLMVLLGVLPTYLLRFSIGPIPTTLLEIFLLIAIIIWFIQEKGWKMSIRDLDPWNRAALLVFAAASFGVVIAPDTIDAFGIWKAYFAEPILFFFIVRRVFKTEDWKAAIGALSFSVIAVSLFAIFQAGTGLGLPAPWDLERRATSIFEFPNAVGLFVAPIVAAVITLLACKTTKRSSHENWLYGATIVLGLIAIVLAETEAALVALPAALLITLWLSHAPTKTKRLATGLGAVLLVLVLLLPATRSKLLLQDYSGQVRLSQWQETGQMLLRNPAFGAGLNAYPTALEPFHDPQLYEIFQYPHNIFLNIWSELGLLALIAFFWLAWLTVRSIRNKPSTLELAAFAALLTMTIHGLVDVPYFKNDLAVLTWILLAMLAPLTTNRIYNRQKVV